MAAPATRKMKTKLSRDDGRLNFKISGGRGCLYERLARAPPGLRFALEPTCARCCSAASTGGGEEWVSVSPRPEPGGCQPCLMPADACSSWRGLADDMYQPGAALRQLRVEARERTTPRNLTEPLCQPADGGKRLWDWKDCKRCLGWVLTSRFKGCVAIWAHI